MEPGRFLKKNNSLHVIVHNTFICHFDETIDEKREKSTPFRSNLMLFSHYSVKIHVQITARLITHALSSPIAEYKSEYLSKFYTLSKICFIKKL